MPDNEEQIGFGSEGWSTDDMLHYLSSPGLGGMQTLYNTYVEDLNWGDQAAPSFLDWFSQHGDPLGYGDTRRKIWNIDRDRKRKIKEFQTEEWLKKSFDTSGLVASGSMTSARNNNIRNLQDQSQTMFAADTPKIYNAADEYSESFYNTLSMLDPDEESNTYGAWDELGGPIESDYGVDELFSDFGGFYDPESEEAQGLTIGDMGIPGETFTQNMNQQLFDQYGSTGAFWEEFFEGLEGNTGMIIGQNINNLTDDYFFDQWNQETGEGSQVGWIYNQVQEALVNDPESLIGGVDGLNACLAGCSEGIGLEISQEDLSNQMGEMGINWGNQQYMLNQLQGTSLQGFSMESLGGATSCMESCYTNALLGTDDAGDF